MIEKHIVLEDIDPVIFLWRKQRQYKNDTSFVSQIKNCGTWKCHQSIGRRRGNVCF